MRGYNVYLVHFKVSHKLCIRWSKATMREAYIVQQSIPIWISTSNSLVSRLCLGMLHCIVQSVLDQAFSLAFQLMQSSASTQDPH